MKHTKKLSLILALIMLMTSLFVFSAEAEAYGDFEYTVLSDGTVEITGHSAAGSNLEQLSDDIIIPSEIDGRTVTSIGSYAFAMTATKHIEIPDTITNIGDYAFYYTIYTFDELYLSENVKKVGQLAFGTNPFLEKIYVEGMDTEFVPWGPRTFFFSEMYFEGIEKDVFADKMTEYLATGDPELEKELASYERFPGTSIHIATIYCHEGSTAEDLAIEYGVEYELMHFFKGEWSYDYNNMIRSRKCIHCDETETEALEQTENEEVEIVAPADPDTDFTVDEIEKASDNYVIIKEALNSAIDTDYEIVKAFDINLTNKDGVHVQPDGTVKVKLPISNADGSFRVYRVNDDGTLTDMNAYREGSHMVFDTDHFSIYVVVEEGSEAVPEEPSAPEEPSVPEENSKKSFIVTLFKALTELFALLKNFINSIF